MNKEQQEQQAQNFIDALTRMQLSPDFDRINRLAVSRNGLDYTPLTETQKCSMLEWLLSPNEGHGLGDYFIKQLLKVVYQTLNQDAEGDPDRLTQRIEQLNIWPSDEVLNSSFCGAFVTCEVPLPDSKNSQKRADRVDLVVYDHSQSTLIVIERKDGAPLGLGQLEKYRAHYEALYGRNNTLARYYLLLDSTERDYSQNKNTTQQELEHWVQLGDDWIKSAIDPLLAQRLVAPDLAEQLRYIRDYVFSYWEETSEPYYKHRDSAFLSFLYQHQADLDQLNSATIMLNDTGCKNETEYKIAELTDTQLFNQVLPVATKTAGAKLTPLQRQAVDRYMRFMPLIRVLREYNVMHVLQEAVRLKFEDSGKPYFATEIDSGRRWHSLCLCPESHTPNPQQAQESEWWPYTLEILFQEAPNAEDALPQPDTVQVILHKDKRCAESLKPLAEKLWQLCKGNRKQLMNLVKAEKTLTFRGQSQVLATFEGKAHLTLEPGWGIYPLIEHLSQITRKISL